MDNRTERKIVRALLHGLRVRWLDHFKPEQERQMRDWVITGFTYSHYDGYSSQHELVITLQPRQTFKQDNIMFANAGSVQSASNTEQS